jgi:hypothetical protein
MTRNLRDWALVLSIIAIVMVAVLLDSALG